MGWVGLGRFVKRRYLWGWVRPLELWFGSVARLGQGMSISALATSLIG